MLYRAAWMRGELHLHKEQMQYASECAHYLVLSFPFTEKVFQEQLQSRPTTHISLLPMVTCNMDCKRSRQM